jgi:DeoR/GlpR family transcriptional regulator of sugar metabolism
LILVAELGEIGPSIASKELDMSLSTVYRDLVALEELHLLQSTDAGKRRLTDQGIEFLGFLMD